MIRFKNYLATILIILNTTCLFSQTSIRTIDVATNFEGLGTFSATSFSQNNIFWLGEQHGTQANYTVGLNYLKYLSRTCGIDYILIEAGFYEELLLNKYLSSGDTVILNKLYGSEATFSNVIEDKRYYTGIFNFYKENPQIKKPKFISIDIEHNWGKALEWVGSNINSSGNTYLAKIKNKKETEIQSMGLNSKDIETMYNEAKKLTQNNEAFDSISYVLNNIMQLFLAYRSESEWDRVRDSCIYRNFEARNVFLNFEKHKSFGKWVNYHTWQVATNTETIASYIATQSPEIKQHTTELLYLNSKFTYPSQFIPTVLKPFFKGAIKHRYTVVSANSNRKMFGNFVKNIKLLQKQATSNVMLFNWMSLPNDNVPYQSRPFIKDKSAIDYVILIQQSAANTPIVK
ncbi:MAG: hypothetical protein AB7S48_16085 [Bacteroidales bacterium]